MAANHTGWLDIPDSFGRRRRCPSSPKREVNTLAVLRHARAPSTHRLHQPRRAHQGGARTATRSASACLQGDALVIFPEGTSERRQPRASVQERAVRRRRNRARRGRRAPHQRYPPVQPVSVAYVGLARHADGPRGPAVLRLVRRHGAGAASVGGVQGRAPSTWWSNSIRRCPSRGGRPQAHGRARRDRGARGRGAGATGFDLAPPHPDEALHRGTATASTRKRRRNNLAL